MAIATKPQGLDAVRGEGAAPQNVGELQKGDILFNGNCILKVAQRLEGGQGLRYGITYRELGGEEAERAKNEGAGGLERMLYAKGAPGGTAVIEGEKLKVGNREFGLSDFVPAEGAGQAEAREGKEYGPRIGAEYDYNEREFRLRAKPVRLEVEGAPEEEPGEEAQAPQPGEGEEEAAPAESATARTQVKEEREYLDMGNPPEDVRQLLDARNKGIIDGVRKEYERECALRYSELRGKEAVGGGLSGEEKKEMGDLYDAMNSDFTLKQPGEKGFGIKRLDDEVTRRLGEYMQGREGFAKDLVEKGYAYDEEKRGFYRMKPVEGAAPAEAQGRSMEGETLANAPEEAGAEATINEDQSVMDIVILARGEEVGEIADSAARKVIAGLSDAEAKEYGIKNFNEIEVNTAMIRIGVDGVTIGYDKYTNNRLKEKIRDEIAAELKRREIGAEYGAFEGKDLSLGVGDDGERVIALNKAGAKE